MKKYGIEKGSYSHSYIIINTERDNAEHHKFFWAHLLATKYETTV